MNIVVLDGYTLNPGDNPWTEIAALGDLTVHDRTPRAQIIERASDAEIVLTNKTPLPKDVLKSLGRLKFISVLATGYNVVDVQAARELGVPVSNVPTYGTNSVAQHTIALLLELAHRVGAHDRSVQEGDWNRSPDFCYWKSPLIELTGLTLGIIGFGRIGQRVAEIARALGMRILYLQKPGSQRTFPNARGVSMEELCRESDVLTLHCALTTENSGFINRQFISQLKPTALLINTARGGLINESELAEALRAGQLGGAALDVLSQEPPPENHPLLGAPKCMITPHIAWTSVKARQSLMQTTVQNIRAFLDQAPINVVNGPLP